MNWLSKAASNISFISQLQLVSPSKTRLWRRISYSLYSLYCNRMLICSKLHLITPNKELFLYSGRTKLAHKQL